VQLVGNSFPAVAHIAAIAEGCARPGFKVVFKLTPQARTETEQAFGAEGRSPFDAAVVSMAVFSNLYARRQLQPLSDLVQKFGPSYRLEERMLVRVDGEVMAIAFMQNTQNLYYRADLFAKHRIAVPTDYAQMVQAAAVLQRQEPSITFPIAQGFAKGFDAGTEFTNILASLGGRFFQPGGALPAFNSAEGVQAVAVMRSLMPYMTPNVLASNADDVVNQFQQGKAAMGVLWASRASRMDDAAASKIVGQMQFAAAPSARPGGRSAAHLWWDAVVLPRNNPRQREATFHVLMEGLSEAAVKTGNDLGIWVRSVYDPGRFGAGVGLSQKAGAPVWPSEPFFSLAHAEVGKVLPEALAGERAPQAVLDAAAASYLRSATEKGFVKRGAAA
jgi:multiple sugar transport system substrate-binding protein